MYKNEDANHPWHHHPWNNVRDNAAYQRTYKHIGRDIKIGQLWVMLAILILLGTTIGGAILSTTFYEPPFKGELAKMLVDLNYKQVVFACCFAVIQCLFLFMGSKYMYRLTVWQIVPVAVIGVGAIIYLFSTPDTRPLSLAAAVVLSPYFLCAGILTLSWRAKLYLAYMSGDFK